MQSRQATSDDMALNYGREILSGLQNATQKGFTTGFIQKIATDPIAHTVPQIPIPETISKIIGTDAIKLANFCKLTERDQRLFVSRFCNSALLGTFQTAFNRLPRDIQTDFIGTSDLWRSRASSLPGHIPGISSLSSWMSWGYDGFRGFLRNHTESKNLKFAAQKGGFILGFAAQWLTLTLLMNRVDDQWKPESSGTLLYYGLSMLAQGASQTCGEFVKEIINGLSDPDDTQYYNEQGDPAELGDEVAAATTQSMQKSSAESSRWSIANIIKMITTAGAEAEYIPSGSRASLT